MTVTAYPIPLDFKPHIWAANEVVKLIAEAQVYKENLKSVFVVNRKITNTAIGRDVGEALAAYLLPVLTATVAQRVVFAEAAAHFFNKCGSTGTIRVKS